MSATTPDIRSICACSHVRRSHPNDGPCETRSGRCPCKGWNPAVPVFDDALPPGVYPVKGYRNGTTLAACSHDETLRTELGICGFCKGAPDTTDGWRLPVKRLVIAPDQLALV